MRRIFLEIDPPTATSQENKTAFVNGRLMHYKSPAAKRTFRVLTEALRPFAPEVPMTGPVRLICYWYFPTKVKKRIGSWKTSRPDTDNLQKALKDVMTRLGYWVDDSLVCSELITKQWSDHPGIEIYYEEIADGKG